MDSQAVRQVMPRKTASRNALGAIGGAITGRIRATLGHLPAMDPHDTRRQFVPNGLDSLGVDLGRRDANQGHVATANDGREPGSRINPRETVLLFWSRWFAMSSQLLGLAQFPQPTRRAQHCHPIGPVSLDLSARAHWPANMLPRTSLLARRTPSADTFLRCPEPGTASGGRSGGLGMPGSHFLAGLAPYLISRTCRHTGRSRWSRCLAAQLLDIPVHRPRLPSRTFRGVRTRPDALPVCAYRSACLSGGLPGRQRLIPVA